MPDPLQQTRDYRRIEKAILFIEDNFKSQPSLEEIAGSIHLSPYHFNRLFKRWAGISPKRFLKFITLDYTKKKLSASKSILETAWDAGLSGPGRLHDLFVTFEAVSPGEFKTRGQGLKIAYGFSPTPFGQCLAAITQRGICHLGFVQHQHRTCAVDILAAAWPNAVLEQAPDQIKTCVNRIFTAGPAGHGQPFHLLVKGTNFQVNVWKALLQIPKGSLVSYRDIAVHLGRPHAARAVGNAVAGNPVAFLIPCHRVIAQSGKFHRYRWGSVRKKAMIAWEAAVVDHQPETPGDPGHGPVA